MQNSKERRQGRFSSEALHPIIGLLGLERSFFIPPFSNKVAFDTGKLSLHIRPQSSTILTQVQNFISTIFQDQFLPGTSVRISVRTLTAFFSLISLDVPYLILKTDNFLYVTSFLLSKAERCSRAEKQKLSVFLLHS